MRLYYVIFLTSAVVCNLEYVSGLVFDDVALTVRDALINLKELIESPARRRKIKELRRARNTTRKSVKHLTDSAADRTEVVTFAVQYKEPDAYKLVKPAAVLTAHNPKRVTPLNRYKPYHTLTNKDKLKYYEAMTNKHQLQYNSRPINQTKATYLANAMTWPRRESKLSRLLSNLTALFARRHPKLVQRPQNVNKISTKQEEYLPKQTETWLRKMKTSKIFPITSRRLETTSSSSTSTFANPLFVISLSRSTSVHPILGHSRSAATSYKTTSKATTSNQTKTSLHIQLSATKRATSDATAILNPSRQRESFSEWLQRLHSEKRQKLKKASGGILFDF